MELQEGHDYQVYISYYLGKKLDRQDDGSTSKNVVGEKDEDDRPKFYKMTLNKIKRPVKEPIKTPPK
jgi:hypothetical protein